MVRIIFITIFLILVCCGCEKRYKVVVVNETQYNLVVRLGNGEITLAPFEISNTNSVEHRKSFFFAEGAIIVGVDNYTNNAGVKYDNTGVTAIPDGMLKKRKTVTVTISENPPNYEFKFDCKIK